MGEFSIIGAAELVGLAGSGSSGEAVGEGRLVGVDDAVMEGDGDGEATKGEAVGEGEDDFRGLVLQLMIGKAQRSVR